MTHAVNQRVERLYSIRAGNQEIICLVCSQHKVRALVKRYRKQLHANVRAIPC